MGLGRDAGAAATAGGGGTGAAAEGIPFDRTCFPGGFDFCVAAADPCSLVAALLFFLVSAGAAGGSSESEDEIST